MKFVKTQDTTGLAYSPLALRPGTTAQVDYSYVAKNDVTWNSDADVEVSISGTTWTSAIQADWPIPDASIDITTSGVWSTVTIDSIGQGVIDLAVHYKIEVSESITAVSAVSESAHIYYDDWYLDEDGRTVPMTVLPLTLPTNVQVYKPEDFAVTFSQPERGVTTLGGDSWLSNSVGTVKMVDNFDDYARSWNLFRKGITEVRVPMACTIEPVVRYELTSGAKTGKYVEIDLQEWDPIRRDVRGILWHRDKLYVMTDSGMYAFGRWSDFSSPETSYTSVTGYDMTYGPNDSFLVTDGATVKVYKVRHDFQHYDRNTETLRFREENPVFRVEE